MNDGEPVDSFDALSPKDKRAALAILAFLRSEEYFTVQEALVYLESYFPRLRIEALANLRDVLDHLVRAAQPDVGDSRLLHHLSEAEEHLRRAGTHPLQDGIDEELGRLEAIARLYFIRKEFYPDVPSEQEFRRRLADAFDLYMKARLSKGEQSRTIHAIQNLRSCLEGLVELRLDTRTSRRSLVFRIAYTLIVAALGALIVKLLGLA